MGRTQNAKYAHFQEQALRMYFVGRIAGTEIAEALNIPASTVYLWIRRDERYSGEHQHHNLRAEAHSKHAAQAEHYGEMPRAELERRIEEVRQDPYFIARQERIREQRTAYTIPEVQGLHGYQDDDPY